MNTGSQSEPYSASAYEFFLYLRKQCYNDSRNAVECQQMKKILWLFLIRIGIVYLLHLGSVRHFGGIGFSHNVSVLTLVFDCRLGTIQINAWRVFLDVCQP